MAFFADEDGFAAAGATFAVLVADAAFVVALTGFFFSSLESTLAFFTAGFVVGVASEALVRLLAAEGDEDEAAAPDAALEVEAFGAAALLDAETLAPDFDVDAVLDVAGMLANVVSAQEAEGESSCHSLTHFIASPKKFWLRPIDVHELLPPSRREQPHVATTLTGTDLRCTRGCSSSQVFEKRTEQLERPGGRLLVTSVITHSLSLSYNQRQIVFTQDVGNNSICTSRQVNAPRWVRHSRTRAPLGTTFERFRAREGVCFWLNKFQTQARTTLTDSSVSIFHCLFS